ncbi:MAG TPA: nucleoside triphosphate pyrophosphohydrolase family protein [Flavobacteriaceae bacterium]|nr:nucleoside triphosphate pyrophosphohydrolase family protein [Flavobacteriaceae bacterium]
MKEKIDAVKAFHKAFNLGNSPAPIADIGKDKIKLRHKLMFEENREYLRAAEADDIVEVADALGDMLYVLCGTIIEHGMQDKIEKVFSKIHQSNMSKLDDDGNPIYRKDGKVLKSNGYFEPNLKEIFEK